MTDETVYAVSVSAASRAIAALLDILAAHGIEATRDPGAFYPQPLGVLVGLPTLTARGMRSYSFTVPVHIVSGDPLNAELPVDRLYALADEVALALRIDQYRPGSYAGGVNAEPLPAVELAALISVTLDPLGGTQ